MNSSSLRKHSMARGRWRHEVAVVHRACHVDRDFVLDSEVVVLEVMQTVDEAISQTQKQQEVTFLPVVQQHLPQSARFHHLTIFSRVSAWMLTRLSSQLLFHFSSPHRMRDTSSRIHLCVIISRSISSKQWWKVTVHLVNRLHLQDLPGPRDRRIYKQNSSLRIWSYVHLSDSLVR